MTTRNPFEILRPILNSSMQKELDSLNRLLDSFKDVSLREIAGEVVSLKKEVTALRNQLSRGVSEIVKRISERIGHFSENERKEVCVSLKKLSVGDLRKVGSEFQLELSGRKPDMLSCLEVWIDSGGEIKPVTKADKERDQVRQLVERAKPLYASSTPESAAELLSVVSTAANLTVAQLKAFAEGIGISVNGTKPKMHDQLKAVIQRRSVSHVQTHS